MSEVAIDDSSAALRQEVQTMCPLFLIFCVRVGKDSVSQELFVEILTTKTLKNAKGQRLFPVERNRSDVKFRTLDHIRGVHRLFMNWAFGYSENPAVAKHLLGDGIFLPDLAPTHLESKVEGYIFCHWREDPSQHRVWTGNIFNVPIVSFKWEKLTSETLKGSLYYTHKHALLAVMPELRDHLSERFGADFTQYFTKVMLYLA
jgi:hypothetical protein